MTRKAKRYVGSAVLLLGLLATWLHLADKDYIYKALFYNFADIDDHLIFEQRTVEAPAIAQPWPHAKSYNKMQLPEKLIRLHQELETVSFLILKQDSILYEQYWDEYSSESLVNSFSVAKSIVSALIGIAIRDGKIKSVNQPVSDFLPSFKEEAKAKITIRHLLMMSSGLNWDESYNNPLSMTTEAYYGTDLLKIIDRLKAVNEPGTVYRYKSGDTQILGFVLLEATGKTLSVYAQEKLWQPLGAEKKAEWSIDKPNGIEKAYCCFFSNAHDFARLGSLYMNNGIWKGDTIIHPDFVKASLTPHNLPTADKAELSDFYGYQWWLLPKYKGQDVFYARGILGQYIIVIPEKEIVIVRLGKKRGPRTGHHPSEVLRMIDAVNEMI
jgi:CubicO group peptidase (beta-lactamase class C family)